LSFSAKEAEIEGLAEVEGNTKSNNYFVQIVSGAQGFVLSIWTGSLLVFGNRRFVWLFPA
jgi:hypothetical protein